MAATSNNKVGGCGRYREHVALSLLFLSICSSTTEEVARFYEDASRSNSRSMQTAIACLNLRGGGKKFKGKMFPSAQEKRMKPLSDRSDFKVDYGKGRDVPEKLEKDWQVMRWLQDDPLKHPTLEHEYDGIDKRFSLHPANQMIILRRLEKERKKAARRKRGLKRRIKALKMMKMEERKMKKSKQVKGASAPTESTKPTVKPSWSRFLLRTVMTYPIPQVHWISHGRQKCPAKETTKTWSESVVLRFADLTC
eukprot:768562-Hanusia_phi.AAC.3